MTEEERKKTILELEQEVLGDKYKRKSKTCEVCGEKLVNDECADHPIYIRMHESYLKTMRKKYEN